MIHCEQCRYWDRLVETDTKGRCRRYPPSQGHWPVSGQWPATEATEWCGEGTSGSGERDGSRKES